MRRWRRRALAVLLLAVFAVSAVYAVAFIARESVAPHANTFSLFAQNHGKPFRLAEVDVSGLRYLVWIGSPKGTMFRLGSGPPCYVFDMRGTLVGWSPISNDGHCEPMASAVGSPHSRHISVAQAEALVAGSSAGTIQPSESGQDEEPAAPK